MPKPSTSQSQVLASTIESSPLSDEFKGMARFNGFITFGDILDYGVSRLPELPQSGYRLYVELLGFLEEHGLLDLAEKLDGDSD
jgi:hypothetical protein